MSQAGRALAHAFESGTLAHKRAFFLRAEPLAFEGVDAEQSFRPDYLRLKNASPRISQGAFEQGLVLLTKHKEENFANIARGWSLLAEGGTLICAGTNEDGAASLEKQIGRAFGLAGTLSKFHSRVFWLVKADRSPPDYWLGLTRLQPVSDGSWLSQPGIFSWDKIDDGSALLAQHLPQDLSGHVADFGCGWGYLARCILGSSAIRHIDLIDAEHRAIEAAQTNITDDRARFHWLDLANEPTPAIYDAVVCNPPFHTGRASTPALGQKVIEAASRALKPGGRLYLVANRGLPYEAMLKAHFASFETLADNNKFKVTRAIR
ncbi:MAG: class I SAM-dependent methyltransferase [Alphaproteobacteria bacterium]|nr:class I SAM-dependent methyltransferase [Alphaproteobacteria bacterium]